MKIEDSLRCEQGQATGPYCEPDASSPLPPTLHHKDSL
jgi:hypothetical protein